MKGGGGGGGGGRVDPEELERRHSTGNRRQGEKIGAEREKELEDELERERCRREEHEAELKREREEREERDYALAEERRRRAYLEDELEAARRERIEAERVAAEVIPHFTPALDHLETHLAKSFHLAGQCSPAVMSAASTEGHLDPEPMYVHPKLCVFPSAAGGGGWFNGCKSRRRGRPLHGAVGRQLLARKRVCSPGDNRQSCLR
jgi:hypothetical protein